MSESGIELKIESAQERLNKAIEQYKPIAVFGLFSGGHDSFCASYVTSLHPQCTGIVHINTGTGIEETRQYVIRTCAHRNWRLLEYKAKENRRANGTPDPQDYEELCRRYGFPGPGMHQTMYVRLKDRQLQQLARDFGANCKGKKKKRIMLVTGARQQESKRRMANTDELRVEGRRIWINPILDWSKLDTTYCLSHVGQPRNIIVDYLHRSGECNCGSFASTPEQAKNELEELSLWPETRPTYEWLKQLEDEVGPKHGWGYGQRPPRTAKGQQEFRGMLCWSCHK